MTYTSKNNNWWNTARTVVSKKKKSHDSRGLNAKKNYSSFWMDDEWDNRSKFSGLTGGERAGSDLVKVIKLSNYRRAIMNFVKIVTKQDIPVLFAGSESYTDGKAICLSTEIKDSNFDVTVGLALHESSHIILTDFTLLPLIFERKHEGVEAFIEKHKKHTYSPWKIDLIKGLLNWVEDRRIDNYIFSTSPGYKAYYHKLYDHYWNDKAILKGMVSNRMRDVQNIDHWMFHIINMINPMFNKYAMPGLDRIVDIVDLKNIARLKSTAESLEIALQIADIILTEGAKDDATRAQEKKQKAAEKDGNENGGTSEEETNEAPSEDVSNVEQQAAEKAYQQQRKFLNGEISKKRATKKLQRQLENISKQSIEVQTVGGTDGIAARSMLLFDFTNAAMVGKFTALNEECRQVSELLYSMAYSDARWKETRAKKDALYNELSELGFEILGTSRCSYGDGARYEQAVTKGLEMGALLGKKLQLHNETRERVDNRLRSGKIDAKRLAHAGYGIENVFKQISIDRYKNANLHITLDASGSMSGDKWEATLQMTVAICKAASYTQGVNVQVSIRVTEPSGSDAPVTCYIYDSRKNKLNHLTNLIKWVSPGSMTPEGLCFEGMYKKNLFVPGNSEMDSYILNISDGEPGCHQYHGSHAVNHTRYWVNKISTEHNIQTLSFFMAVGDYGQLVQQFNEGCSGRNFRHMYGKDAAVVDPASALGIAKELNKKFMAKI